MKRKKWKLHVQTLSSKKVTRVYSSHEQVWIGRKRNSVTKTQASHRAPRIAKANTIKGHGGVLMPRWHEHAGVYKPLATTRRHTQTHWIAAANSNTITTPKQAQAPVQQHKNKYTNKLQNNNIVQNCTSKPQRWENA